jgi:hypothetical protein
MDCNYNESEAGPQHSSKFAKKWLPVIFCFALLLDLLFSELHRHNSWTIAGIIFFLVVIISTISPRASLWFLYFMIGTIGHLRISSPEMERRIRTRYQDEINQLTNLGFNYAFSDGEFFSLFRLIFILPALTLIHMKSKSEIISLQDGIKIVIGHPVLISDRPMAFSEASGLGVKFYTAFQDGTLLISKAYADADIPAGPMIRKYAEVAGIEEIWAKHQKRIAELEAEGKQIDRQTSFEFYAEIEYKETAPW